jgi:hypothetical protein
LPIKASLLDVNRQKLDERNWLEFGPNWFSSTSKQYLSTNSKWGAKVALSLLIFKGLDIMYSDQYCHNNKKQNFISL